MKTSLKSIIQEEFRKQLNEQDPRDVMKNPDAPMPYVNLNGNDEESLIKDSYDAMQAIEDAMKAVSKSDVFHGRNSVDSNHQKALRGKRDEIVQKLREFYTYFDDILRYIDNLG